MVQWLRFRAPTAKSMGLIPGQGSKILQAHGAASKKKKRKHTMLQGFHFRKQVPGLFHLGVQVQERQETKSFPGINEHG